MNPLYCRKCKKPHDLLNSVCAHCGAHQPVMEIFRCDTTEEAQADEAVQEAELKRDSSMATTMLIDCPACGMVVSSAAISCPKCGHPIARTKQKKGSFFRQAFGAAMVVLGFFYVNGVTKIHGSFPGDGVDATVPLLLLGILWVGGVLLFTSGISRR